MFLQLYCFHYKKNLKDFVTKHQTSIMHMPTVSWQSKVLNHRSKNFYFFMYIFGWFTQEFPLESYRFACLDDPASASDNLIGSDFYRQPVSFAQKQVLSVTQAGAQTHRKQPCRSDACGSYCSAETGYFTRALQREKSISPLWLQITGANIGVQLSELIALRGHLCCAFCTQVLHSYFALKRKCCNWFERLRQLGYVCRCTNNRILPGSLERERPSRPT